MGNQVARLLCCSTAMENEKETFTSLPAGAPSAQHNFEARMPCEKNERGNYELNDDQLAAIFVRFAQIQVEIRSSAVEPRTSPQGRLLSNEVSTEDRAGDRPAGLEAQRKANRGRKGGAQAQEPRYEAKKAKSYITFGPKFLAEEVYNKCKVESGSRAGKFLFLLLQELMNSKNRSYNWWRDVTLDPAQTQMRNLIPVAISEAVLVHIWGCGMEAGRDGETYIQFKKRVSNTFYQHISTMKP